MKDLSIFCEFNMKTFFLQTWETKRRSKCEVGLAVTVAGVGTRKMVILLTVGDLGIIAARGALTFRQRFFGGTQDQTFENHDAMFSNFLG